MTNDPGHIYILLLTGPFHPGDANFLVAYCGAVVRERVASGELAAGGYVVGGKPSPWASLLNDAIRDLSVASRLLRLAVLIANQIRVY
jgi:hypothetical protein